MKVEMTDEIFTPDTSALNPAELEARDEVINIQDKHLSASNRAEGLDDEVLEDIGERVVAEYGVDKESRSEWEANLKQAMSLVMQTYEQKDFPFQGAANIKYPLISTAAIQFSARAMPNLIQSANLVKCKVVGDDPEGLKAARADRISAFMSYQCLDEMSEWEEDMDKLLTALPILGCCFKKTYYDGLLKRPVSKYISPEYVVINYYARDMETAPRITEEYVLYPNEIEERKRSGFFLDVCFESVPGESLQENSFSDDAPIVSSDDPDQPHTFLEQHRYWDLDGDGYAEPYIVTVHKDSRKVVRVANRFDSEGIKKDKDGKIIRIEPVHYFTKFSFMPSPDGSIYDLGFGRLLGPLNRAINSNTNQLLDSGTIANSQAGFMGKGLQMGKGKLGGKLSLGLNEWKAVAFTGDDLRKNIFPLPTKEPSPTLLNLLTFLIQAGDKLSSVSDIMTGTQTIHNEPATTTMARIEQGQQVFSAVHKRLYRAAKKEYQKLFRLNRLYLAQNTYFTFQDDKDALAKRDFNDKDINVLPVGSPDEISNMQKVVKAQALTQYIGSGFLDDQEVVRRNLEAMGEDNIQALLPKVEAPPDPQLVLDERKQKLEEDKFAWQQTIYQDEMAETQAKIIKLLADAEAAEEGSQLERYKAIAEDIRQIGEQNGAAGAGVQQGAMAPMDAAPSNQGATPMAGGQPGQPL